jgi:hypothetical protein
LAQGKKFSEVEVRKIAIAVLNILTYLHELNPPVLHRDVKPSNLIWSQVETSTNKDPQIYLVDFGAVQDRAAVEGATFTVVGTYGYAPMEQFGGRAIAPSDLYALGATLIHLLTGTAPADLPQRELRIQFSDRTSTSRTLIQWIEKLTEPSVERRFSTARQALAALKSGRCLSASSNHKIQKPAHSRIQISSSAQQLLIQLPSQKISLSRVVALGIQTLFIGVFGLGLGATTIALLTTILPGRLLILIPLWVVWFTIVYASLLDTFGRQRITFDHQHFLIEWWLFQHCCSRQQGNIAEIQDVFQSVQITNQRSFRFGESSSQGQEMVTIQANPQRYSFGLGLAPLECLWIAHEIKSWLKLKQP